VPDVAELLAAYDAQVRGRIPDPLPRGVTVERDGPLVRCFGLAGRGVLYRDLGGLEGGDLNELISRQVRVFAERGERFEWKLHGHDRPGDLPQWLRAAGFVPEDTETVVIAPVEDIAGDVRLTDRVSLREVTSRADFERIAALEQAVWGDEDQQSWLVDMLESERAVDPDGLTIIVAEAAATVVCAAWIRFERGTQFATLCDAATLPEWRRRGSTEQPWPTELTSPPAVASATSRRTLQALAARSSNVSASPRSPRPPHTCGLRRQFRQRTLSPLLSFDAAAPGLSTRAPAGDLPTRRDTASLGISRSTPSGSKKGREPRRQQAEGDGGSHSPRIRTSPTGAAGSTPSAYTRIVTERPPYFLRPTHRRRRSRAGAALPPGEGATPQPISPWLGNRPRPRGARWHARNSNGDDLARIRARPTRGGDRRFEARRHRSLPRSGVPPWPPRFAPRGRARFASRQAFRDSFELDARLTQTGRCRLLSGLELRRLHKG
jgi:hypothetical protein